MTPHAPSNPGNPSFVKTLERNLDLLGRDREADHWMRAFFEKRLSSGFSASSTDPIDWVIPLTSNHSSRSEVLTVWVCGMLRDIAQQKRPGPVDLREEYLLEGLFAWCACCPTPEAFGPVLQAYLKHSDFQPEYGWTSSLTRALKRALIYNQVDNSLCPLWTQLLDGREPEPGLGRYWPEDYDGLLHMPTLGKDPFDWASIGRSLKNIFETLLPQDNPKALSPTGPMPDLYKRLGRLAHLDEVALADKLWECARRSKWSEAQQQTIPKQFYRQRDGFWIIPRVAEEKMLHWKLQFGDDESTIICKISHKDYQSMTEKEISVIRQYEARRKGSPRRWRREMFIENMGGYVSLARRKIALKKEIGKKRMNPEAIYRRKGSKIFI